MMHSAFFVPMLTMCLMALHCTADVPANDKVSDIDVSDLTRSPPAGPGAPSPSLPSGSPPDSNLNGPAKDSSNGSLDIGNGRESEALTEDIDSAGDQRSSEVDKVITTTTKAATLPADEGSFTDNTDTSIKRGEDPAILQAPTTTISREAPKDKLATDSEHTQEGEKPLQEATPPVHKAAGTSENGLKGPEPPTTDNTNNKVVKNTTKTPDPLPAPTAEGQTSSSNSQQATAPIPPKTSPAAPSDEDKPQQQILSAPAVKDKGTSTHKDQRNSNTIQQPLQPKQHQKPQPPPPTQEKPQAPATPPASTKHKGVTNGTTTSVTAPATADKNPVPPATPKNISTTAQGSAASTTAITSGDKEINPTQTSISSTLEPAKRDITHPANHSQTTSKALQSLDNTDGSSGSSSLIILAWLTTVIVMAVVSAS